MVGLNGLEPSTSRLSGVRSNQLSYRPPLRKYERDCTLKTKQTKTVYKLFCLAHRSSFILRKEVIQPHLTIQLPRYDFPPIISPTLRGWLLTVTPPTSGVPN